MLILPSILAALLWHGLLWLPAAVLVTMVLIALVLWLYPPQVRMLRRGWRWLLPALRILAVLALVASVLRPTVVRPSTEQEQGAIVVLVDRSGSMAVKDTRTPPQLVALAQAMGQLRPEARQNAGAALQEGLDEMASLTDEVVRSRSDLEYARLSSHGVDTAQQRAEGATAQLAAAGRALAARAAELPHQADAAAITALGQLPEWHDRESWSHEMEGRLDRARSVLNQLQGSADQQLYENDDGVQAACDELGRLSRFDLVQRALVTPQNGLLRELPADAPLFGFAFSDDVAPLPLRGKGQPVRQLLTQPEGTLSDPTGAVQRVLDQLKGQSVQAVLLFSDGRQVGSSAGLSSALSAEGVPVFAICPAPAGDRSGTRDLAIARVGMPASQFAGETITVRVELRNLNMDAANAEVHLSVGEPRRTGDSTASTTRPAEQMRRVTVPTNQMVSVEFQLKLEQAGIYPVSVSATPLPGEATDENNRSQRWVKVLSEKRKVAVISSTPGWDYQYLRNALSRTASVKLEEAALTREGATLALSPQQLLDQNVIVLHDVAVGALNDAQWDAVHRLVTERGGSVVLVAGAGHLPAEYADHVVLSDLLPYRAGLKPAWHVWPGEEPAFRLVPAPGTQALDVLKLADDPSLNRQRWQQLPAVFRYLPIPEPKPNLSRILLVEEGSGAPVLTESRLGLGRVFFLGADETWRWRYKVGERDQDRFWLQLLAYATEEPYAATDGTVSLDLDPVAATPDQPVNVRARVLDANGMGVSAPNQPLRILRKEADGQEREIRQQLLPMQGGSAYGGGGRYAASISGLSAGEYEVETPSPAGGAAKTLRLPLHVARSNEAEMADVSPDWQRLRRAADATRGEVLTLDQVDRLPHKLVEARSRRPGITEKRLWDSPYLFLFVLACLGTEWALRKRLGLA